MITDRRSFLTGLAGVFAAAVAPAIIRTPGLIMPIKPTLVVAPVLNITNAGLVLMQRAGRESAPALTAGLTVVGVEYRWIRESVMGEIDHANLADAAAKGWRPVDGIQRIALTQNGTIFPGTF